MAKDKDKDKKKNKNGGINSTPSRTFEVGGNLPGTVATGAESYGALPFGSTPATLEQLAGLAPSKYPGVVNPNPVGTYGGAAGVPASMINPATGGLITTATELGDPKGVLAAKAKEADDKKYSDDPVLAFQQKEADKAREEEKKRQERVDKGLEKIDTAFAGFNDNFYAQREQDYKDYYMGQLEPEFKKARENLTFALARAGLGTTAGTAGSSAETTQKALNEGDIANKTAQVSSQAAADKSKTQAQIETEKSALIAALNANADADQAGNAATDKTAQLMSQAPDYNWVPDVFFGAAQGVGGLAQAAQNTAYTTAFNGGVGTPKPSGGITSGGTTVY